MIMKYVMVNTLLSLAPKPIPIMMKPAIQPFWTNNIVSKYDIAWEKTNDYKNINNKYFYNKDYIIEDNVETKYGEIFKIQGVPAALLIINKTDNYYYVEKFVFNKNLILMFDAGPMLRWSYYNKFKNISFKNAENKDEFLII